MTVAILGANGFVGFSLYEAWQRHGPYSPRGVVKSPASLARIARFAGEWRLANATDEKALTTAFAGCEAVVHCVAGDDRVIAATVEPAYRAACAAGVRDLLFISSASVHGQNPPAGVNEEFPLRDDQPLAYNNAKVRAERHLRQLAADQRVRVTILRPGIVWGARSRWVVDVVDALQENRAWWIDGGRGLCNSIYVGNLVYAIERALSSPAALGQTFLVGDMETVTWRDFYLAVAAIVGRDETAFLEAVAVPLPKRGWREHLDALRASGPAQAALPWFSPKLKDSVKAVIGRWRAVPPPDRWALTAPVGPPCASYEMAQLFACRTKYPHDKAVKTFGYHPPISFAEGMRRTSEWLRAAGYPIAVDASVQ